MSYSPDETHVHGNCRARLIEAAAEAFLEKGYRASVDNIAAKAGVAKQTLYNNFGNKEELFREVGTRLADSLAEELFLGRDGLAETLYRFGLEMRNRALSDKGIAIYRSFHMESARVPEMAMAIHGRVTCRIVEILSSYLSAAMDRQQLRRDDPKFAAEMLTSMLIHADRSQRLAGGPLLSDEENAVRTRKITECFLRAYRFE
ncbi:hypothetical protein DLREEDagrD3_11980 [Denitratisoma sp. agr-D3]